MSAEREIAAEDSIKVVCRFRPLNDSEEKAGSKFIVKFPNNQEENCISIAVSYFPNFHSTIQCSTNNSIQNDIYNNNNKKKMKCTKFRRCVIDNNGFLLNIKGYFVEEEMFWCAQ